MTAASSFEDGDYYMGDKRVRLYSVEHLRYNNIYRRLSPLKLVEGLKVSYGMECYVFARMLRWPEQLKSDWPGVSHIIYDGRNRGLGEGPYFNGQADRLWQAAAYVLDCYGADHPNDMIGLAEAIEDGGDISGFVEAVKIPENLRAPLVTEVFGKVIKALELDEGQLYFMIGISSPDLVMLKHGEYVLPQEGKYVEFAILIIRIYQALYKLYHGDMEAMRDWFRSECVPLHGEPMKVLGKIETLVEAVTYLEEAAFGGKEPLEGLVSAITDENIHHEIKL